MHVSRHDSLRDHLKEDRVERTMNYDNKKSGDWKPHLRGVKDRSNALSTQVGIVGKGLTLCDSKNWLLIAATFSMKKETKTS